MDGGIAIVLWNNKYSGEASTGEWHLHWNSVERRILWIREWSLQVMAWTVENCGLRENGMDSGVVRIGELCGWGNRVHRTMAWTVE